MTNNIEKKTPKTPKRPNTNRLPVNVKSYFKNGKRIKGYKRHKAGDAPTKDDRT